MVKGGRIVEQGSHKELMARPDGAYTALAKLQLAAPPAAAAAADAGAEEEPKKETSSLPAGTALSPQPSLEKQVSMCMTIVLLFLLWHGLKGALLGVSRQHVSVHGVYVSAGVCHCSAAAEREEGGESVGHCNGRCPAGAQGTSACAGSSRGRGIQGALEFSPRKQCSCPLAMLKPCSQQRAFLWSPCHVE